MKIHQEVTIPGAPAAVYDILTSSKKFAQMTGGRAAEIGKEAGAAFSMFGGDIAGRNVEMVPGKRVVQAWRAGGWPEGVYSLVTFQLSAEGKGTKVVFDQVGHPEGADEMLASGWQQMYWSPMTTMLGG
ncbi:MAG: SRPBCC domain-containing protein [Devosia sp.]